MNAVNYQEIGRKVCEIDRLLRTEILVKDGKNQEKSYGKTLLSNIKLTKESAASCFLPAITLEQWLILC